MSIITYKYRVYCNGLLLIGGGRAHWEFNDRAQAEDCARQHGIKTIQRINLETDERQNIRVAYKKEVPNAD